MKTHPATRALALLIASGALATCDLDMEMQSGSAQQALTTVSLVPTSDVDKSSVVGVGDSVNLYLDVDDGTGFASADDSTTYVRGTAGTATTSHTAGYSGGPAGTVTSVTVNYRAQRGSATGTAQVFLLDGTTQIGAGAVNTLGAFANFSDTFSGLSVADVNHLRTRIVFNNTAGAGALRYTMIWISATLSQSLANTAPPVVTGTPAVGATLTTDDGSWTSAPTSFSYQWQQCDSAGASCASIAGATAPSYVVAISDLGHVLRASVTASNSGGSATASSAAVGPINFAAGTRCNASGTSYPKPATYRNIIVIMMENENASSITSSVAPFFTTLRTDCNYSAAFKDNLFSSNLPSLPHYLALTSGSNCTTGLGDLSQSPSGTGCITDDNPPSNHRLSTTTIFNQVTSWRAYMESMPSACTTTSSSPYVVRHNPPPYYTTIASSECTAADLGFSTVSCSTTPNTPCTPSPANAFADDLNGDTLAQLTFVSPDLDNDMHGVSGTTLTNAQKVTKGDNWLATYMPIIFSSAAYRRGDVAVWILWDEAQTNGGNAPDAFVSPFVTRLGTGSPSTTPVNLFAALRGIESQLGITTHLGCASGTITNGTCPAGSTEDLRTLFNF